MDVDLSPELEAVQRFIIVFHRKRFEDSLSPMKLQKLCYYAEGIHLGETGRSLFKEDFEAWTHGPVISSLYHRYKGLSWRNISEEMSEEFDFDEKTKEFLEKIVSAFGCYDGAALSRMTHSEAPWIEARKGLPEFQGSKEIISKQSIENYFKKEFGRNV